MSTSAAPRLRLVKACSCPTLPDLLGEVHCHRCGGTIELVHPRERLLEGAVVEAARHLVATMLVEERESLRSPEGPAYTARVVDVADALQTVRDSCAALRAYRGGAR